MTEDERWQGWLVGFKSNDSRIIQEFWEQYGPMLHRVAEAHLADRLRQRVGAEDVVQSVCRTFFRRVQGGQLTLTDSETLWRLLCAITLTKVREQARYHSRQKRGMMQEVHAMPHPDDSNAAFDLAARGPSPHEAAAFADQFEQILGVLDEEERQIVDLKLQECTHDEVADRLGISERTVRRLFKRIQTKLARVIEV